MSDSDTSTLNLDSRRTADLTASLDLSPINVAFAHAVIDGSVDGRVWISPRVDTGAAHIYHPYGMSLVWGDRVDEAFPELIAHLRRADYRTRTEWLQIDPRWNHLPWPEHLQNVVVHSRLNFAFSPKLFVDRRAEFTTPAGWTIEPADAADFARDGSVVPRDFWRTSHDFLRAGGGRKALRNGEYGAMAFTSFRSSDTLELGIETAPPARRQGLGAAVAAALIAETLASDIEPVWACNATNIASHKLAEHLGFTRTHQHPYYELMPRS